MKNNFFNKNMSGTVMHGRRKGQSRSAEGMHQQNAPNMTIDEIRQMTILSKEDWERINNSLNRKAIEEERIRKMKEAKEEMKRKSKEAVKGWTNTIAGTRAKKLEARKIREAKEEEERKAIDIEEAKYQAQLRKERIEKAKTQQYFQTDRVKQFHGALMLTEVLKEREAQLELKRLKEMANDGKDQELYENDQREYEAALRKEKMEAFERNKARKAAADFQKAQIQKHIEEQNAERDQDNREGEELKRLGIQFALEKQRLDQIARAEQKQCMLDNLQQIDDVKRMKEVARKQDKDEDEECRIFAQAKRKMMKLRAEKESELHNEKQKRLEKIRDKLSTQMKQMKDDEDERLYKAVEESEAKRNAEETNKMEKQAKTLREMAHHRNEQMRQQQEQAALERRKELEMMQLRKEADALFRQNEQEKRARQFGESRILQDYRQNQIDNRRQEEIDARNQELAQAKMNMGLLQLEEGQFQEYAQKVIEHCEKGKRNTYALRRAAREGGGGGLGPIFPGKGGIRPSYMTADQAGVQLPLYQRDTTEETKEIIHAGGPSDKRLGFVW